ncbi:hypothetical protein BT67DRAFT_376679 [Trichocladium antarcticum]|uniref:Copper acquisition factor BIM1-like domain-containing protein n=1 Tax=Trichocladium antarcticum TaxID=1450529 RepID=A0AAN6ZFJ0_9PEZI|nr:hypothetical protein BT67DRAFT_376679 [Trichocladium antarcticum]
MLPSTLVAIASAAVASAHTVISYPGWRGNNLVTNSTFPFGMQWMYPCGGMPTTTNRTFWPTVGGAVAFQPGWFQGHATAFVYINLGLGNEGPDDARHLHGPPNMSNPMISPLQLLGPSKAPFPGTFCLPQVPLPVNTTVKAGDNATIQVVELAVHGAALYSCVDITFADPGDPRIPHVNETNCFNSSDIGVADIYTLTLRAPGQSSVESGARRTLALDGNAAVAYLGYLPVVLGGLWALL